MNCTASTDRIKEELKAAAFYYAGEFGLPVFPLQSGGKVPRRGSHGYKDAATNIEQIEEWWTESPNANIGIPCGKVSGLYVVDGKDGVTQIQGLGSPTVKTPKGGHWYFRWRAGLPTTLRIEGVDCVRSDGFYVAVPPSVRSDGCYEWIKPFSYSALPDFPSALHSASSAVSDQHNNSKLTPGSRHVALKDLAVKLWRDNYTPDAIHSILLRHNDEYSAPPKPEEEVRKIAEWTGTMEGHNSPNDTETDADDGPIIRPLPITELIDADPIEYVWYPYLATGMITLFVALWKIGKTTLISHLAKAMSGGGGVGGEVKQGRLLIVSEESPAMWKGRRDELGIGNHVDLVCRPFMHRPNSLKWYKAILEIAVLVKSRSYQAVIIDTLGDLSPCDDENDASKVIESVKPLRQITEAGAALMLIHHPNKSDGGEAKASRGSGALPGFVDIIMEMRRFDALRHEDTRRVLKTYSRLDSGEQVLDLTPQGYICKGSKFDATRRARLETIDTILSSEAGKTVDQIREDWPEDQKPPYKSGLNRDLKHGVESEDWTWTRSGEGKKGDPFLYWRDKA